MTGHVPNSSRERGQSLMELALSMTFILILLAGVVDLGRAFFTYITLRDAVQEGAAFGAYEPADEAAITLRARQTSNTPINLTADSNVNFNVSVSQACAGGEVTVTATYRDFPITMPFIGALVGRQSFDISASTTDDVITPMVCAPSS
jgi:Flp pilus assembly protein TadG